MADDLDVDEIVFLREQFSRPPLSRAQLSNLRQRLLDERRDRVVEDGAEAGEQVGARAAEGS